MTRDEARERAEKCVAQIEAELDDSISLAQQHRMLMGYVGKAIVDAERAGLERAAEATRCYKCEAEVRTLAAEGGKE